ncbi:hypothetical protein NMG60_11031137 [Bertholletia excelsa]
MGVDMMETGVQMKRILMFSIKTCYRSVCNHPFLVSIVLVLIFLYRSFPSMFSLLLSASPVLVSTAILLGTLLSFGQPNIPEIDKEEKKTNEMMSLRTGIPRDATVIERDESFVAEKYSGKSGRDVVDKSIEEASSATDTVSEVDKCYGNFVSALPAVEENSQEIQVEKQVIEEVERELDNSEFNMKTEMDGERIGDVVLLRQPYCQIEKAEDENIELLQHDKSPVESIDSRMADHAGSSPHLLWKQGKEEEEELDDDDDVSDIGSDRAESSSPDASMADIIPMLDELHPLLDEEAPQPIHMSHDGSDAGSEKSRKSSNGTNESDDDSENHEEEIGDDDEEDEEGTRGGKDNTCKSAITWTEDDQKNLMDLGTLELERNQRLENLIARRRARRMMTEKNLIDFESADLLFNIAPISTTRRNPFDSPYSNDNTHLPPIPGSAPSVLLARHNPFDLPYDSSEEKPDLTGDSFQQEFMTCPPKEMLFRRRESFNVGPSIFAPSKQENQNINLKPYFVPEQTDSEVAGYSSFQRQPSELSDSKVSSVPETESICSAEDTGDKKLSEEDFFIEADMISDVEHPSEHIGHGSESSDDEDALEFGQAEIGVIGCNKVKGKLGDVQRNPELLSSISEAKDIASPAEHNPGEIHLNRKGNEGNCSSRSSSASLSELHERIFHEKGEESSTSLLFKEVNIIEEKSECHASIRLVDDSQQKDPVYDLCPQVSQENLSSYVSSNQKIETHEGIAPILVQRPVPAVHGESEAANQSVDTDASGNCQILTGLLVVDPGDKNETITSGVTERDELVFPNREFSGDDKNLDSADTSLPESVGGNASVNLKPFSDIEAEEEYVMCQDRRYQRKQDQVLSSSLVTDTDAMDPQTVGDVALSTSSPKNKLAENSILTAPEEQPAVVEQAPDIHTIVLPSENELTDVPPLMKEAAIQSEYEQVHSPSSASSFFMAIEQQSNEGLLSRTSDHLSEEITIYELEQPIYQLEKEVASDKAMAELSSGSNEELPEPASLQVESILKVSSTNNSNASDIPLESSVCSNIQPPSIPPEPTSFPSEASQIQSPAILDDPKDDSLDEELENSDPILVQSFNFPAEATSSHVCEKDVHEEAEEGIKEIDEKLLMELDTVGDFSVKNIGSNFNEIEHSWLPDGAMNTEMPLVTAKSVEDIDLKTEPVLAKTEVEIGGEFETPERGQIKEDIDCGTHALEAQSLEDSDAAFRQISDQEIVNFSVHKAPDAGIIIKEDINSGMPVLEAQSLEDIDAVFRQINEQEIVNSNVYKAPDAGMIEETKAECSVDDILHKYSSLAKLQLPVPEERSIEKHIELALKQHNDAEGCSIPSSIECGMNFVESNGKEEEDSDYLLVEQVMKPNSVENDVPEETSSNLHLSEARLPEDDNASKLASEGTAEILPKADVKDGSTESSSSSSSDSE